MLRLIYTLNEFQDMGVAYAASFDEMGYFQLRKNTHAEFGFASQPAYLKIFMSAQAFASTTENSNLARPKMIKVGLPYLPPDT